MSAIAFFAPKVPVRFKPKGIFVQETDWTLWVADRNGSPRQISAKALLGGELRNYIEQIIANEDGTVTRRYSELRQLVDEILLRVGEIDYFSDGLDARLRQAEASIQLTSTQILNRVWLEDFAVFRNDLTEIEAILRRQESRITQTAQMINARVTRQEFEVVKRDNEYLSLLIKQEESERRQTADEIRDSVAQQIFDLDQNLQTLIFSQIQQLADQISSVVGEFTPGGELCTLLEDYEAAGVHECSPLATDVKAGDVIFVIPLGNYTPIPGTIVADAEAGDVAVDVDFGTVDIPAGSKVYISGAYLYSRILQTKDEIDLSVNQIDARTLGMVIGVTDGAATSSSSINLTSTLPIGLFVDDVVTVDGVRYSVTADRTTAQSTIPVTPNITYASGKEVILSSVSGKGMVSRINLSPAGVKIQGKLISIDGDTAFSAGYGPADVTAAARKRILVSATGSVSVTHDNIAVTGISYILGDGTTHSGWSIDAGGGLGVNATRYLFGNVDTGAVSLKSTATGAANEVLLLTATTSSESGIPGSYVWQGGSTVISGNRIATGSITADRIKAGTITATQIGAGTITADRLNAGVITSITNDVNTAVAKKILVAVRGSITATNNSISWTGVQVLLGNGMTLNPSNGSQGSLDPNTTRYLCVNVDSGALTVRQNNGDVTANEVLIATATTSVDAAYAGTVVLQAGSTVISGSTIVADSIVGSKLRAGTITADKLAGSVISTIADSVEPGVVGSIAFHTIVRVQGSLTVTQNSVTFSGVALTYGDLWSDFMSGFTAIPAGSSYNSGTGVLSGLSQNTSYVIYATRVSSAGFTARVAVEGTNPGANEKRVGTFKTGNADSNNVGSYQFTSGQVVIAGNSIAAGSVSASLIKTGLLQSANWSTTEGSEINMASGVIRFGGSTAPKFSVTSAGVVTMTGAVVSGAITATSGAITGSVTMGDTGGIHVQIDGANRRIRTSNFSVSGGSVTGFDIDGATGQLTANGLSVGGIFSGGGLVAWGDTELGFGRLSIDVDTHEIKIGPSILGNPQKIGFYGATPINKPTITGATDSQKITSIISVLASLGLATNGT